MTRQNLMVEFLLITAAANLIRSVENTSNGWQSPAAAGKTTSSPESSNRPRAATPALPDTAGNGRNTTSKPISNHTTPASKGTSRAAHKNRTSVPTTTAPVDPTLAANPSPAPLGTYNVSNGSADCVKAIMGLTMIVKSKRRNSLEYFNIDPNSTHTLGACGPWVSTLKISFEAGFIQFTFAKNGDVYYVVLIEATLKVPSEGALYGGLNSHQFFSTSVGNSFKCSSAQTVDMSDNLQLLLVNSQLQAFEIVGNQFGKEEVCALDRNKKLIPILVSLSLAGFIVILIVTCIIYRRKAHTGYDRI